MTKQQEINVLLVDDELDFLQATSPPLTRRGFNVIRAENGVEALKILETIETDVVVLDMKMPGLDGETVFQRIKDSWPTLPVVILTGHGTVQQAFEISRDGVFEYLTKPCSIDEMAETLRRATKTRQNARGPR